MLDAKASTQTVLNAGYKKVNAAPVAKKVAAPKAEPVQYVAPQPAPAPAPAPQPAPQPAPTQQQSDENAQMALLLEQFNKILASND